MKDLCLGILGCGARSGIATFAHTPGKGTAVTACCDLNEELRERLQERYGRDLFFTTDFRRLLERDLDAVFVLSPDYLHAEHALAALEKGIAVYLEKPMAITTEECDALLTMAQKTGARLFVGHNMRYMPLFRKMRELIRSGAIGEIKSVWCRHFVSYGGDAYFRDWHAESGKTTGLLLQKGSHDIDMIHWLTGAYTTRVSAFGNLAVYGDLPKRNLSEPARMHWSEKNWPPRTTGNYNPAMDVEDQNVMIMELEGGILASYLQCHFTPDACRNYTVIGTEGRIENFGNEADAPIFLWNQRADRYRMIGDEVYRGEEAQGGHGGADPIIVEEFLRLVREGGTGTATPEAARMAVAAGYEATLSLRSGGIPRTIPPLPAPLHGN